MLPERNILASRLRFRLREATSNAHASLDDAVNQLKLENSADYKHFLEAIASALLPIEAALAEAHINQIIPDWSSRTRSKAILCDVASLDGEPAPLPFAERFNKFRMLGTVYVLEGSRLGGRVLLKSVLASNDHRVRSATSYLRHGENIPQLWATFVMLLDGQFGTAADEADAIDAAQRTFDFFSKAFS